MATEPSTSYLPGTILPPLTSYPIDGNQGSYYDVQFSIPVYNNEAPNVYNTLSWHDIDRYGEYGVASAIESAVAFTLCAATLLNIIVLTPVQKRRLPLHVVLCCALALQIIRSAVDMVLLSNYISMSAYCYLTRDIDATKLSFANRSLITVEHLSACISLVLVEICFFIQARGLLSWLRIHRHAMYSLVLTYLVLCGVVATAFRIGLAGLQISRPLDQMDRGDARMVSNASYITHGITIASWSSVSFASTVSIIINRRQILLRGLSVYDAALNLIAVVFLESFIVPIVLCLMAIFQFGQLRQPAQLIVPSVLFLLPLGSLFLTVHDGQHDGSNAGDKSAAAVNETVISELSGASAAKTVHSFGIGKTESTLSDTLSNDQVILGDKHTLLGVRDHQKKKIPDLFEIELASIDALGHSKQASTTRNIGEEGARNPIAELGA